MPSLARVSSCSSRGMMKIKNNLMRHASAVSSLGLARPARKVVRVQAVDAAQPFDFEHKATTKMAAEGKLKIGIVGFGTFGQFLAQRFAAKGHRVLATSRSNYHDIAKQIGCDYYTDANDFCEEHPDVVVLATSILSTESVLKSLPVQRLKRSTLFVDVLSVKEFPKQLLLSTLPPEVDVLCCHPMFGPDSGKGSWQGLNFMFERVRIQGAPDGKRHKRCETFLNFFKEEGCRMVEMTCEEHDIQAASTQFVTHTVGRMLGAMQLKSTDINTKGFDALLNLVNNTANDSFELYYGLFLYNQNATDELERLENAFEAVKKQLLGRLHDIARAQIFPDGMVGPRGAQLGTLPSAPAQPPLPSALAPASLPPASKTIDITAKPVETGKK